MRVKAIEDAFRLLEESPIEATHKNHEDEELATGPMHFSPSISDCDDDGCDYWNSLQRYLFEPLAEPSVPTRAAFSSAVGNLAS